MFCVHPIFVQQERSPGKRRARGACMATDRSFESRSRPPADLEPGRIDEVTQRNVQMIEQLREADNANRSRADRIADFIARFCGSMTFVWVHVIWFGGWLLINSLDGTEHFDPYPFTFLTFVVSLEAIFLSTFILISQNHGTRSAKSATNWACRSIC